VSYALGILTLMAIALSSSLIPAWRAARVDPARVLKEE
jgi:ABC-type lipoprotein release transport system permease subunit